MTAYLAATWQNLPCSVARPFVPAASRPAPAPRSRREQSCAETQPMLYRSEAFAEDLFDAYRSR